MIKIENVETMGWKHAIRGMRNPKNSWDKSDSKVCAGHEFGLCDNCSEKSDCINDGGFLVGENNLKLMMTLRNAGTDHRKFMRMITVYLDITAPLYWWKEFDTYKVGTVANSCSTMHKIHDKEFTLEDFSYERLDGETMALFDDRNIIYDDGSTGMYKCSAYDFMCIICNVLNNYRNLYNETGDKKYWDSMIQLLPTSYNQKRTVMLNYEVLANMYKSRKNHKLDEWRELCKWIESLPYSELITG